MCSQKRALCVSACVTAVLAWAPASANGQPLPGPCTIDFEPPPCPNAATQCGADFLGGDGCIFAGLPFCYSSGLFSYGVTAGSSLTILLNGDLLKLDVFFVEQGASSTGTMTFFDGDDMQVDAPLSTNGDCLLVMPRSQVVSFSRAVRRIEVVASVGTVWIDDFTVNPHTQIPAILSSDPPDGAIDARQPASLVDDCATPAGWDGIDIDFDIDATNVVAGDFTITVDPADVAPPSISDLSTDGNTVSLTLDGIIPTSHWTIFTHDPSSTSTRLGYLPADVNGDGTSSPVDILELIDHLNGVIVLPEWGTDVDRSGVTNPADILTVIDLLNGADCFDVWNGATLP